MSVAPQPTDRTLARRTLVVVAVAIALLAIAHTLWAAVQIVLLAFAGVLLGVFLHGVAGDLAAKRLGVWSMLAGDLAEDLPSAFLEYDKHQGAP